MANPTKFIASCMEYAGLIGFFLIYKFAPHEYALRAASIFLLIFTFIQIAYFKLNKIKMTRAMIFANVVTILFSIPTIVFNDFQYVRIKLLILKTVMFVVPLIFLLFKANFLYVLFGDLHGLEKLDKREFNIINWWFIALSGISLLITIYAYISLDDDAFLTLKTFWLPILGIGYIIPIMYYLFKKEYKLQTNK
ncbi:septation protein IspZ [Psittacicella hinzii]|uniref:Intracellular septation protein A n=1 Tax=Psittacicella hinzii TaxID=2028575 RepID=A0A3A1Y9Y6_9GAMM|nr:septation protein IspZ [Psittacicella hinzii]RIY34351.1 hypothetical protein CKF58_08250 [Psittacicella hinzii]